MYPLDGKAVGLGGLEGGGFILFCLCSFSCWCCAAAGFCLLLTREEEDRDLENEIAFSYYPCRRQ